jgi:hypothetical protein
LLLVGVVVGVMVGVVVGVKLFCESPLKRTDDFCHQLGMEGSSENDFRVIVIRNDGKHII